MRRGVMVGVLGVLLVGGITGVLVASSGGDSGRSATGASSTTIAPNADVVAARRAIDARGTEPGRNARHEDALDALVAGIAGLRGLPGIEAECAVLGSEAGKVEATIFIDPSSRSYDATETTFPLFGGAFTEERQLIAGTLYLRVLTTGADPTTTRWDSVVLPNGDGAELDRSFTAFGRIADSLDRVAVLVEKVPGRVELLGGERETRRYRISIPARRIGAFYQQTGLEVVDHEPHGTTTFEFGVDGTGGLVGLAQYGTTFHDGEALEDSFVECRYAAAEPRAVTPPPELLIRP